MDHRPNSMRKSCCDGHGVRNSFTAWQASRNVVRIYISVSVTLMRVNKQIVIFYCTYTDIEKRYKIY